MERFAFDRQIAHMEEKNLLYEVVKRFAGVDLSPERVDNAQMGYVFEELIRIGAEQSNEEAGEHFTPREVIKLMVNLLLAPERDLRKSHSAAVTAGTSGTARARSGASPPLSAPPSRSPSSPNLGRAAPRAAAWRSETLKADGRVLRPKCILRNTGRRSTRGRR